MLNNDQLYGLIPVIVVNSTPSGKKIIESKNAYIHKVHQGDRQGVFASVRIGKNLVDRWIFANYQPGDENYRPIES